MKLVIKILSALLIFIIQFSFAQEPRKWGDQSGGVYFNPILPGDFQNTDVIRAGDTYYYISATKVMSPGMLIMSSKDMVNWKYIGHAIPDLTQMSSSYSHNKMEGESRAVWAGSIRYHNKRFYIHFTDPDNGVYMTSAAKPEGPWEPLTQLLKGPKWDDPCPLWDDDGQAYLVMTDILNGYKIYLFKMSADGKAIDRASGKVLYQGRGSEASKLYKINGYYYHFYSEVTAAGRMPFMARSKNIFGPYETRRQLIGKAEAEPNQGGMLQTKKGEWYFITHHGSAYWGGREGSLLPVTWTDGWPVWGVPDKDGVGTMVWSGKKPIAGPKVMQASDEFRKKILSPQWEWFFQPDHTKWSLTQRKGYLRLYATKPLQAAVLKKIPNILTQRPLRVSNNTATVKADLAHMADGQIFGLALFGKTSAIAGVSQTGTSRSFYFEENGRIAADSAMPLFTKEIWLCAVWNAEGIAHFLYSVNGKNFTAIGKPYQIVNFSNYLGAKLGVFTSNEKAGNGYIDLDWFHYDYQ